MIGIEDQRRAGKPADGQNGDAVRLAPGDPQIVPRQETVKRAAGGLIVVLKRPTECDQAKGDRVSEQDCHDSLKRSR